MRILVLNYELPPIGGGGGRVSLDVAGELASRGHEVKILTSWHTGLPRNEVIKGVDVQRVPCLRQRRDRCSVPEMAAFVAVATPAAISVARKWKPAVTHVHFAVPTGAVAYAVRRTVGTPYLMTAHLGDVPDGVPEQTGHLFRFLNPMVKPIWRAASRTTAVSSFVAGLAKKAYGCEPHVIFNGVRAPAGPPPSLELGFPTRLVFVGRMNPQKNLPFLIELLARLKSAPWHLDVVGDGSDRARVEELIGAHELASRITLHGWQDDSAIDSFLYNADVLAMPSLSEGFPLVGARALAAGLAIFGSTANGLDDIVVDGLNGVRISPTGVEDGARAMTSLLMDRERLGAMRRASFERARQFDLAQIAGTYETLLAETATCA